MNSVYRGVMHTLDDSHWMREYRISTKNNGIIDIILPEAGYVGYTKPNTNTECFKTLRHLKPIEINYKPYFLLHKNLDFLIIGDSVSYSYLINECDIYGPYSTKEEAEAMKLNIIEKLRIVSQIEQLAK